MYGYIPDFLEPILLHPGTANTVLNDAVFGSTDTANTGITLLGSGQVGIAFGDAANTEIAQIRYQHSTNAMEFRTNGAEAMVIDSGGDLWISTKPEAGNLVSRVGQLTMRWMCCRHW